MRIVGAQIHLWGSGLPSNMRGAHKHELYVLCMEAKGYTP